MLTAQPFILPAFPELFRIEIRIELLIVFVISVKLLTVPYLFVISKLPLPCQVLGT